MVSPIVSLVPVSYTHLVAVGADVHGERNVEARAPVDDGLGVLGDLAVEHVGRGVIAGLDAVLVACRNAASAAHAAIVVDAGHVHRASSAAGKLDVYKRQDPLSSSTLAPFLTLSPTTTLASAALAAAPPEYPSDLTSSETTIAPFS